MGLGPCLSLNIRLSASQIPTEPLLDLPQRKHGLVLCKRCVTGWLPLHYPALMALLAAFGGLFGRFCGV